MNFEQVLQSLLSGLDRETIRYAVIGGFALGALGVPRATMDFDLLVHREDLERLHQILASLGYERRVQTQNVSHYAHASDAWGSIDVLHAFRTFALAMLERATAHSVLGGARQLRVLQPEDLIGLKVQALANDPARRTRETADIEALMARHGRRLDWNRIREYYTLFELADEGKQLQERFKDAQ